MALFAVEFARVSRPLAGDAGGAVTAVCLAQAAGLAVVFTRAMLLGVGFAVPRFAVLFGVGASTGFLVFFFNRCCFVFWRGLFAGLFFHWCCPGNGASLFLWCLPV